MEETHVFTCVLRQGGEVLLVRRSESVGTYTGRWGMVSGYAEGDPDGAARREIEEETGLGDAADLVRAGDPFAVEDAALDRRWVVHPYLFDCGSRDVDPNEEVADWEWTAPTAILRRETVPDLWRSYRRVAPTVETVRTDRTHGAAYISLRAMEVLRDRAAELAFGDADGDRGTSGGRGGSTAAWDELVDLATELLDARPSMTVVANRVNRLMSEAADGRTAASVERAARDRIRRALAADRDAALAAAERIADLRVATLSRSGTVLDALFRGEPAAVLLPESRPGGEGVAVAERLAAAGLDVTLTTDAALAHAIARRDVDAVVFGADTVLSDGRVVNKVGSRAAALAGRHEHCAVYAVAARDKISPGGEPHTDERDPGELYDGDADLTVANPTFDVTPSDLLDGVVTEDGTLVPADVRAVARDHRQLTDWQPDRDATNGG
ncbi:initiation factor 2B [Halobacteriales archaeon QS_1_68_17]|nr:MAG: initiation factor 2B [Halobacteriales archaeon QS_1_68_17]